MFKKLKMNKVKRLLEKRINSMIEKGKDKEKIMEKAEKVGWSKETIDEILESIVEKKKEEK